MKKITLLCASAAMVASLSASAAAPKAARSSQAQATIQPQKIENLQVAKSTAAPVKFVGLTAKQNIAKASAATTSTGVSYRMPSTLFHLGMSPEGSAYTISSAIGGYKGYTTFTNTSSQQADFTWSYQLLTDTEETPMTTRTATDLVYKNDPRSYGMYGFPTLSATIDGSEYTYGNTSEYAMQCGGSIAMLGFDSTVGVTPCPAPASPSQNASLITYLLYDKSGAEEGIDATSGVASEWAELIPTYYDEEFTVTSVKFSAFNEILPATTSPYLISKLWMWMQTTATAETALNCELYKYDSELGDFETTPFAKGEATVEAGTSYLQNFALYATDEDGDESDEDIIVDTAVMVRIFGIADNDAITACEPVVCTSTTYPIDGSYRTYWPGIHSYIELEFTDNEGDTYTDYFSCPYAYYGDSSKTTLLIPGDYYLMVDAVFPYAYNADTTKSSDNLTISVDNASNEGSIEISTYYYDLLTLIENGYVEVETDADWIDYTISPYDEETYNTTITVKADAIPEDVAGRSAHITFTGIAQDFTITVNQGEVDGINEIQNNINNGTVEYFDLQGRKLNAAPAAGLYIQRQGNKAQKVVVR